VTDFLLFSFFCELTKRLKKKSFFKRREEEFVQKFMEEFGLKNEEAFEEEKLIVDPFCSKNENINAEQNITISKNVNNGGEEKTFLQEFAAGGLLPMARLQIHIPEIGVVSFLS
jgi:hypothetical protein